MIVRTPPPAPPLPSVPIERIELDLDLGDLSGRCTYYAAEEVDLVACINVIVNPEHRVLGATVRFTDGTELEIPPSWFEIAASAAAAGVSWPGPPTTSD